jgi:phenylpropionate dioxygenase-like ring-hydroxylating dioxygenase large terminal subunit
MAEARFTVRTTQGTTRVPVTPITAERYISPEYMLRERQKLWPRVWLLAGLEQDVSEPGDYFVFDLEPESIIVSRSNNGELGAFYNVCQHRGARVLLSERGSLNEYTCPYHGWTYANDGTLTRVPDEDRFSRGVPRDQRSLKPLRVEAWAGAVWVCMDPDAPSLDEFLGPIKALVDPFRPEEMRLIEDQTVRLDCNWKAVYDNFGELYHVEHIHPQHETIFDCPASVVDLWEFGHTRVSIDGFTVNTRLPIPDEVPPSQWATLEALGLNKDDYKGRVLDVRRDVQIKKREKAAALGYNYDLLSDEQLSDIVQYNIFPNSVLVLMPDDYMILRARPHPTDPNKCYWDKLSLRMDPDERAQAKVNISFSQEQRDKTGNAARPERDEFDYQDIVEGRKTMTITQDQDISLIRDIQKGMHSRGFSEAWLCDDESRVQHYHTWIDRYMES